MSFDNSLDATMFGTYMLEDSVPVEPEIVLTNCTDTARLGQLVSLFQGDPDVRFFLVNSAQEDSVDLTADSYFIKDDGDWVLSNNNTLLNVHFDDAGFNPAGNEGTFSLVLGDDGAYSVAMGNELSGGQLLVDLAEDDLFVDGVDYAAHEGDSLFVDPSILEQGTDEIIVSNFMVGSNTLELAENMSIKDVFVDNTHDLTEVHVGQNDTMQDDIVVKLLGVSQPDLPIQDYGMDAESPTDNLITHLINSGLQTD